MEILLGELSTPARLADIPLPAQTGQPGAARHEALVLVPYQQVTERGFAAAADGSPLLVISVTDQGQIATPDALRRLPDEPITLVGGGFDIDDDAYASTVRAVLATRSAPARARTSSSGARSSPTIADYSPRSALCLFRRLLVRSRCLLDLPRAHRCPYLRRRHPGAPRQPAAAASRS